MNRMTSDNTFEMNMHQLALNQVYIGSGQAWYLKGPDEECSVCDLIRGAAETLNVELPILSDEDLSGLMTDWLQYGEEEPEGILAILYRALWAMAEVRARLSRYEDTGLEPEEIAVEKPSCVFYCNRKCNLNGDFCAEGPGCPFELDGARARKFLLQITEPNDPLAQEELREMDGESVWVHLPACGMNAVVCVQRDGRIVLFGAKDGRGEHVIFDDWARLGMLKIYRRKPEEGRS